MSGKLNWDKTRNQRTRRTTTEPLLRPTYLHATRGGRCLACGTGIKKNDKITRINNKWIHLFCA